MIRSLLSLGLIGVITVLPLRSLAADLNRIERRGHLVVAVKDNLRPLGFRGADGQLQGLEIDIARRLAQELLGRPDAVVFKPVLNQNRMTVLLKDEADIAIAQMTATSIRTRVVAFSIPYYMDGTAFVTQNPAVRTTSDLGEGAIAVFNNSNTVALIRHRFPKAQLIGVESYQAAQESLERGEAIAFAADASVLSGWVQEFPQYRLILPTLSVQPLAIVLPKGVQYSALQQRINEILAEWHSDGWLRERATYWGLP